MFFNTDKLAVYTKEIENCSIDGNSFFVEEKMKKYKIDLNRISNVRIIKTRELFVNYIFLIAILLLVFFFNNFVNNSFYLPFILYLSCLLAIIASFRVKIYRHYLLINTIDLSFVKVNINYKKKNRYCL